VPQLRRKDCVVVNGASEPKRDPRMAWPLYCKAALIVIEDQSRACALNFLLTRSLFKFADEALIDPAFARELPLYVAAVRQIFTTAELSLHLDTLVMEQDRDGCDPEQEPYQATGTREIVGQPWYPGLRDFLTIPQLGIA
jgi:hypothetical protein